MQHDASTRAPIRCIVVTGPTATGKTGLGVKLCDALDGEIISADSRQVYQGLDLGTGKDYELYETEKGRIPTHLIDVASPHEQYHLYRYLRDVHEALDTICARGRIPVFVGGSPLYIKAVLEAYRLEGGGPDPELRQALANDSKEALREKLYEEAPDLYERTDITQHKRLIRGIEIARSRDLPNMNTPDVELPPLYPLLVAPFFPRPEIHERIAKRLDERLEEGLTEEVQRLHEEQGLTWEQLDYFGLEYRYTAMYLKGELDAEQFRSRLLAAIRHLCKSQEIWFRKIEREGHEIYWIRRGESSEALSLAERFLNNESLPPPEFQLKDIKYDSKGRMRAA